MPSDYAVWSGYQMDVQSFRDFMGMVCGSEEDDILDVIADYNRWKRRLPPKYLAKTPRIRWRASDPREENITHIFFPVRWIPFKTKRQLNDPAHPDYDAVHKATEKDEAKLGRWLDCVDEMLEGKCRVERDKFEFSVMKELHPMVEWRNY